jgi:hypothetical protein
MTILTHPVRALACAMLAASPVHAAFAQAAADPQAAVPATTYRRAIDYRAEPQPESGADQRWRAANAAVAGYNPMMLTMKPKGGHAMPQADGAPAHAHPDMHAGHDMHAGQAMHATPAVAAPAPQRPPAAPLDGAGHARHMHGETQ